MKILVTIIILFYFSFFASADESTYSNPIVFQRFENNETNSATPDVPGFYGGASIWVMESDGSNLKLLRHPGYGTNAKHLDHPSISSNGRYVFYAEFESATTGRQGEAQLYREDLQTKISCLLYTSPSPRD